LKSKREIQQVENTTKRKLHSISAKYMRLYLNFEIVYYFRIWSWWSWRI